MKIKNLLTGILALAALSANAQTKYAGGDLSMLTKYEEAKVAYYDINGSKIENGKLLEFLRDDAGFNIVRVRLFVNPTGATGVCQDLDYVKALGKRIKDAGMAFMLDFHYSDTWADPSNQYTPSAWTSLSDADLCTKIYDYTKECLTTLKDYGATPDFIQTGNEISYGMLWGASGSSSLKKCYTSSTANWDRFINLLTKAGQACREVCPAAKIIIHTERTGNWSTTKGIYDKLSTIDYDIIGLSYYPEWHNNLSTLKTTLNNCHNTYPSKDVMIVETGYYNNWYRSDATYNFESTWPASPEGQKAFITDLVAATKDLDYLKGIIYWFPEENQSANNTVYAPWYNHGLFQTSNGFATAALYALQGFLGNSTDTPGDTNDNYYILGADNDWSTSGGTPNYVAMTKNDDGTYSYSFTCTATVWLCFSNVNTCSDWDIFNSTYRIGPSSNTVATIGSTYDVVKGPGNISFEVAAGSYLLTLNPTNMKVTVSKPTDTGVESITQATNTRHPSPDTSIHDLQGRRVNGMQKPGVYIRNNRKILK